jgi:hypothetical protein
MIFFNSEGANAIVKNLTKIPATIMPIIARTVAWLTPTVSTA